MITLGSLFDGSGGFPLAGVINDIYPVWASEIEPYPLKVTAAKFPNMKQLGDVTKINGAEIEPVDIITFGSPCQDLSIAGKQAGIHDGERSNLFFQAIRIIKEMRNKTNGQYPRFALWENVPGAFSSNKGEDFRAVLEAFANVCGDNISIPRPPKNKWIKRGGVAGDGWSLAWRVYDAQYWGVPQRRKRIYLVADFASERATEILFECEGLCGDTQESGKSWKRTTDDAEGGSGRSSGVKCLNPWDVQSKHIVTPDGVTEAMCAAEKRWAAMPPNICYSIEGNTIDRACNKNGKGWCENVSPTLNTQDKHAIAFEPRAAVQINTENHIGTVCPTLRAIMGDNKPAVCYPDVARSLCARANSSPCIDRGQNVVVYGVDCRNATLDEEKTHTIQAKPGGGFSLNCTPSVCYRNSGYGEFVEGAGTLRANGGDIGGHRKHYC